MHPDASGSSRGDGGPRRSDAVGGDDGLTVLENPPLCVFDAGPAIGYLVPLGV